MSEFNQRVNYNRALQGELERSIATVAAVQKARVHLVVPEKSLFRTAEQQASASVVLQLHAGRRLTPPQVQGIVHLVASSVEGLQPDRVTVLDGRGEVLSQKSGKEAEATAALSYQHEVEGRYTQAAQELLEKTVGRGHAAVQVNARMDTSQAERTREEFDPDQQVVRSEQEVEDSVGQGSENAGGVAGARGNLPGGPPPQTSPSEGTHRKSTTRNYEVGRNISKITEPGGRVERLTVAVLVDGTYPPAGPAGKDKAPGERKFVPRTQQELDNYAAIVREAVGFDAKRGDQIEVRCVPFAAGPEGDGLDMTEVKDIIPPWAYALLGAGLLGMGAALLQLVRRRREVATLLPAGLQLPSSVAQIEEGMRAPELKALPDPTESDDRQLMAARRARKEAVEMITAQPERSVQVLRAWINQSKQDEEQEKDRGA
jgi:flagellar M-ring protein FliF